MDIKLKNKYLYFNKYKIKCAIGKRGITRKKVEGDNKTPAGIFKFQGIFYRKDRLPNFKTSLKKKAINDNNGKFVIKTVQGGILTASLKDGKVILTDVKGNISTIVITDVEASNGVIHAIDSVVMPE